MSSCGVADWWRIEIVETRLPRTRECRCLLLQVELLLNAARCMRLTQTQTQDSVSRRAAVVREEDLV